MYTTLSSWWVESLEEMVNELSIQKDVPEQPEWMDIDGLRQYIPSHPAKQTIYGWVNDKLIPYYKTSKKLTFKKSEIDEWLHQGRRKSTEDLQREASEFINLKRKKGGMIHLSVTAQNLDEGLRFLEEQQAPYVLKADGLAAGKGVLIISDLEEAKTELRAMLEGKFGNASATACPHPCGGHSFRGNLF